MNFECFHKSSWQKGHEDSHVDDKRYKMSFFFPFLSLSRRRRRGKAGENRRADDAQEHENDEEPIQLGFTFLQTVTTFG